MGLKNRAEALIYSLEYVNDPGNALLRLERLRGTEGVSVIFTKHQNHRTKH